jgi:hypothetical protein
LHRTALVEPDKEGKGFEVVELQQRSVDLQKSRRHSNGDPLVSINERMVLRQALPEPPNLAISWTWTAITSSIVGYEVTEPDVGAVPGAHQ